MNRDDLPEEVRDYFCPHGVFLGDANPGRPCKKCTSEELDVLLGEAMTPQPCECRVEYSVLGEVTLPTPRIIYCPLHAAAPGWRRFVEAWAEIHQSCCQGTIGYGETCIHKDARAAIARAKGDR